MHQNKNKLNELWKIRAEVQQQINHKSKQIRKLENEIYRMQAKIEDINEEMYKTLNRKNKPEKTAAKRKFHRKH